MDPKRIIKIQDFCFIAGIVMMFVFGSILIFIHYEIRMQEEINNKLNSTNTMEVALLERPQKKRLFRHTHYYYSYSGHHGSSAFSRIEKVDVDYFHISSPGKNVEIKIYKDPSGNLHTLLRGNEIPFGRNFSGLYLISVLFFSLGACFIFTAISLRLYSGSFA